MTKYSPGVIRRTHPAVTPWKPLLIFCRDPLEYPLISRMPGHAAESFDPLSNNAIVLRVRSPNGVQCLRDDRGFCKHTLAAKVRQAHGRRAGSGVQASPEEGKDGWMTESLFLGTLKVRVRVGVPGRGGGVGSIGSITSLLNPFSTALHQPQQDESWILVESKRGSSCSSIPEHTAACWPTWVRRP